MSRRRSRLHAKIPVPNDNVTIAAGNKVLADSVFRETGLDLFLDGLKRSQGNSVSAETIALVANSVEMTGLSVNRLDRLLDNDAVREEYGLDANAPRSVYRTVERLGRNSDTIVSFLGDVLKRRYDVRMDTVFMDWTWIDDNVSFMRTKGNLGRTRYIFRNTKLRSDIMYRYRSKAEHDWDEMQTIRKNIDSGRRPRKKYRNSNYFVDTRLSYLFPLGGREKTEAIERAVNNMMTGREGLFVLVSNRPLTASEILGLYRSRNDIETMFRDLKHGIDWRPARCTSEDAIRGRILISFLALFCMSMIRFLYPEFRGKTAESISEELSSFSITVLVADGEQKKRVFSNFGRIIRHLWYGKVAVPVPKAPGQTTIDGS